jgi:hypothetical protein
MQSWSKASTENNMFLLFRVCDSEVHTTYVQVYTKWLPKTNQNYQKHNLEDDISQSQGLHFSAHHCPTIIGWTSVDFGGLWWTSGDFNGLRRTFGGLRWTQAGNRWGDTHPAFNTTTTTFAQRLFQIVLLLLPQSWRPSGWLWYCNGGLLQVWRWPNSEHRRCTFIQVPAELWLEDRCTGHAGTGYIGIAARSINACRYDSRVRRAGAEVAQPHRPAAPIPSLIVGQSKQNAIILKDVYSRKTTRLCFFF